ncbi:MAG TPA: dihydrolipoamide acetyltransferase family protein [Polyangiaceae bacterium]|jgi:pyruvate dehydrogenase E2 component (dihydrolipoamide acetyltransferase)|nr:dihydrolipoamide acetyltransferase family protein [Polyangiaceae bacterium]
MSKIEFKLPDIGEGVTEGEIVSWLVKVGDSVEEHQDMVEVMTDKATVPLGAPTAGKIAELRAKAGDTVPVGQVIVVIESAGAVEAAPAKAAPAAANGTETKASAVGDIKEQLPGMSPPSAPSPKAGAYFSEQPLAAPATRKLARELGVDLRQVPPSGEAGRITKTDVQSFAEGSRSTAGHAAPAAAATPAVVPVPALAPVPVGAMEERLPIRGLRKRIYESMARSKRTAAHFTYVDECECTKLIALRERLRPLAQTHGVKLTFLPFIIKAVVAALKRHPSMNCLVDDTTQEMVLRKTYDLGIAVATDAGLIVPVLRRADQRNLIEIAREIERLANEARAGKTTREDLGGASFTVTSLGKAGGLLATPVVNYPEVGILFVPAMKKRPVVIDDEIKIGNVMDLSLSFDHRIIDGHIGAEFTQTVIDLLQNPDELVLSL